MKSWFGRQVRQQERTAGTGLFLFLENNFFPLLRFFVSIEFSTCFTNLPKTCFGGHFVIINHNQVARLLINNIATTIKI